MTAGYDQWIRRASLIVYKPQFTETATTTEIQPGVEVQTVTATPANSPGIDLSALEFNFRVEAADVQSPNKAVIHIVNPSQKTSQAIGSEFTRVVLNAGYQDGNYGVIFDGTIKQVVRGRTNATDTFVEIRAADGDLATLFGLSNTTVPAGTPFDQQIKAVAQAFETYGVTLDNTTQVTGGILPRGKVMFGLGRDVMRQMTKQNYSWSIQNGKVVITPLVGYLPSQAVVLTAKTGMIGVPEATDNGIMVRCLLNPRLVCGGLVRLDNASINTTQILSQGFAQYTGINYVASTSNDGIYRILVAEHQGQTRGNDWYTELTCLATNPTAPNPVLPYG